MTTPESGAIGEPVHRRRAEFEPCTKLRINAGADAANVSLALNMSVQPHFAAVAEQEFGTLETL